MHFHSNAELERRKITAPLLSAPQFLHLAVRCANVTTDRLLLQPLHPDDILALCASGPMSSIFLVRLLRHLLLTVLLFLVF